MHGKAQTAFDIAFSNITILVKLLSVVSENVRVCGLLDHTVRITVFIWINCNKSSQLNEYYTITNNEGKTGWWFADDNDSDDDE